MLKLNTASFVPFYEQIKKQIKSKISLGELKSGDLLPSIRDLATELLINPNTVARAYRELEKDGFISTRKGKGCFVSEDSSALIEKERTELLNQIFDEAINEAKRFNLSKEGMKKIFDQRLMLLKKEINKGGGK